MEDRINIFARSIFMSHIRFKAGKRYKKGRKIPSEESAINRKKLWKDTKVFVLSEV